MEQYPPPVLYTTINAATEAKNKNQYNPVYFLAVSIYE